MRGPAIRLLSWILYPFCAIVGKIWDRRWRRNLWRPEHEQDLIRRQQSNPVNPMWAERLGYLYYSRMLETVGEDRVKLAASAVRYYTKWRSLSGPIGHDYSDLPQLARAAIEANELDAAQQWANELSNLAKSHSDWGNTYHYAHITLGRIAVRRGKVNDAKEHLAKAARTTGSPQLVSYGPSTQLAQELLAAGEREAVASYYECCAHFWYYGRALAEQWACQIRNGEEPDLGRSRRL